MIESNIIILNFRLCVVLQNVSGLVGVNYISVSGSIPYVDAELDIELLDGEGFVETGSHLHQRKGEVAIEKAKDQCKR